MSDASEPVGDGVTMYRRRMRGVATFFIAISCIGLAAVLVVAALGGTDQYPVEAMFDRGIYAVVTLVAAIMVWNGSRFAALALLLVILTGLLDITALDDPRALGGIIRTFVYSGLAIWMLWSAHKYHKACAKQSTPIGGSRIIRWGGLVIVVPLLALIGLGFATLFSQVGTTVVSASEMKQQHFEWLVEQNYLQADERLLFFYSEGVLSIEEGGSLLTDKYIGGWWQEDGKQVSQWYRLGEICKIELVTEGSALSDASYKIHGAGEENWLTLILSAEDAGDQRFIRRLKVLNTRNMHAQVKAACGAGTAIDYAALSLSQGIEPGIVVAANVKPDQIEWLRDADYLTDEETPLQFYSSGIYHINEGGVLLTDDYLRGWNLENGTEQFYWAKLGEICSFEAIETDDDNGKGTYKIFFGEEYWYQFKLPTQGAGDEAFIKQVKAMNDTAKTPETEATCEKNRQSQAENTGE